MSRILEWAEISGCFEQGGLILGNGASRAVDDKFRYTNLYDHAKAKNLISDEIDEVFKYFQTDDFEFVLHMLWHAYNVNKALKIKDTRIVDEYEKVRSGLIQTVTAIHDRKKIEGFLPKIYNFLGGFRTVCSLNYDIIIYWAMMTANNAAFNGENRFKDCFINGQFDSQGWRGYYKPSGNLTAATLVFYPHGNLCLAFFQQGEERKLDRSDKNIDLVDLIVAEWTSGDYLPLFVSEGSTNQKEKAIRRSFYLSTIYDEVLPEIEKNIVAYGWSFNDRDIHILKRLNRNIQKFAVSVHVENDSTFCNDVKRKIYASVGKNVEVLFFNAESKGCWIY